MSRKGELLDVLRVVVRWRDVLAVHAFCADDPERFDLWGARVEMSRSEGVEWEAVIVACDGRRLVAVDSCVTINGVWPLNVPTAFTIPRPILSRVKKPGKSAGDALVEVKFHYVGYPADTEKEESANTNIFENLSVWAAWDAVRLSMRAVPMDYPKWKSVLPAGPYTIARDIKLNAGKLADFSATSLMVCGDPTVALYRGEVPEDSEEGVQPLIVRGISERFVGMIMPERMEIGSTFLLPLWASN